MKAVQMKSRIYVMLCSFCTIAICCFICPIASYSQTIENGASGGLSPRPTGDSDNDCPVGYMYECGPDPMGSHEYTCSCVPQAVRKTDKRISSITPVTTCTPVKTCTVWDRQSFGCMIAATVYAPWCKPKCLHYEESGCESSDSQSAPQFDIGITGSGM